MFLKDYMKKDNKCFSAGKKIEMIKTQLVIKATM